ncbi:uncharacterized protein LOC143196632 isoform X2 [Rhynchophorus ferrugineus]
MASLPIVFGLLKSVASKIREVELSNKTEETIDDIILVLNMILQNLTGLFSDQVKKMKMEQIYQHMGFTLLNLLDFLLSIDKETCTLKKLLEPVFSITCNVVKSITLDVFCEWAEVEYEEQPLQTVIAGKAYLVIEKYQKSKLASELISLLGNIARKPKTVIEQIQEADIDTIIKKVNTKDENQKQWFKAMLNTRVFNDPKVVQCLSQWWDLCDESDVDRLLNLQLPNNEKHRELIIQCAKNINVCDLKGVLTIYFYRHKFVWKEDIQREVTKLFNQAQNTFTDDNLKTILLMILRNAYQFFTFFFETVLKAPLEQYRQVLEVANDILKIDNIGLNIILKLLEEKTPSSLNVDKYFNLFNMLIDCKLYTWDFIVLNMLIPLTDQYKLSADYIGELGGCIEIFKKFSHLQCETGNERDIVEFMLTCASEHRCKSFTEFVPLKEEIVRNCVEYIIERKLPSHLSICQDLNDPWTNYYKDLILRNDIIKLLDYLIPNFDLTFYSDNKADENVTKLLKVLPRCSAPEWKIITAEIEEKCGYKITINALTDIVVLLCDVINQTKNSPEGGLMVSLRFCLEMFGSYVSQAMNKTKAEQILGINSMCRLLKHLPEELKHTEGIILVNLLPSEPLKDLAADKEFLARIIMINDKQICKVLAEKMLN